MIHVHLLPELVSPEELSGGVAVVIDILRASTTICHALEAGAKHVVPCLTIGDALEYKQGSRDNILLGGERGGVKIDGFDLGNSPESYTIKLVEEKVVAFTTTNGTKALHRCDKAERVVIGAFVNLGAIVVCLQDAKGPIHLLCAGTNGAITSEDVLFAGAVVDAWCEKTDNPVLANDSATLALDFWRHNSQNNDQFAKAMHNSQGGKNLTRLGLQSDINRAMQFDIFEYVPIWDPVRNVITRLG